MPERRTTLKRILVGLLILSSLASAAACGSDTPNTETNDVNTSDTTSEPVTDYLEQYNGTDLEGATYTFAVYTTEQYPNYAGDELNGETVNDVQYNRDVFVESTYNVNLEYITHVDGSIVNTIRSQVQAGDTDIDCVMSQMSGMLSTLSTEGMLYNLYNVEGLDLEADWWSQSMNREFTIQNKLFTTTGAIAFSYYYSPRIVAFNLRLAEEYGLGNLYDVVESGKWTLDYMYDTMKAVKADLNGDGEYGEDDMWGASVDEYSAAGFYISAGGTQIKNDESGNPAFAFEDQKNYEIIEKVASIIGNDDVTQKAEELANRSGTYDITDKVYTFKNGHALYLGYGAQAIAFYLRDMNDDYGILPVPKYDEAQEEYITFGNSFVPAYVALPMNNSRGEINGILLNTLGYMSQRDVQPNIVDVLLKGKAARDEESQRMIDIIYEDIYLDINSCYNFAQSFILLRDITMGKKENFASEWAKIKTQAETEMAKLYEQFAEIE